MATGSEGDTTITPDSPIGYKKFIVGFQGGFDGFDPRHYQHSGSGRWNSTESAYDSGSYYDALATAKSMETLFNIYSS